MRRWPPCASTISLQSGRPRPEPPGLVEPLLDRGVDLVHPMPLLGTAVDDARGVEERADRREGVVQLVVEHADGALPHLDLLPPQLRREAVGDPEQVRAAVEVERPPGQMVRLAADGEEGVALLAEGVAQRGGAAEELVEEAALEALAGREELARRAVGVDDAPRLSGEDDGQRRRLQHGLEEELALQRLVALRA